MGCSRQARTLCWGAAAAPSGGLTRALSTPGAATTCWTPTCRPNTADQLRSGAPVGLAGGGTGRHLSLPYGCRPELRQLHPLVRRPRVSSIGEDEFTRGLPRRAILVSAGRA